MDRYLIAVVLIKRFILATQAKTIKTAEDVAFFFIKITNGHFLTQRVQSRTRLHIFLHGINIVLRTRETRTLQNSTQAVQRRLALRRTHHKAGLGCELIGSKYSVIHTGTQSRHNNRHPKQRINLTQPRLLGLFLFGSRLFRFHIHICRNLFRHYFPH